MTINKQWNPKRIYKDSKAWLEEGLSFHYQLPHGELEDYVHGRPLEFGYGNVIGALRDLGSWYEREFIVQANEEEEDCAKSLFLSFDYHFGKALVNDGYWATLKTIGFGESLNDFTFYLAKGISLGCWDEAEVLGKSILKNIARHDWFSSLYGTKLAPFMLSIFCDWQKMPLPDKDRFEPMPDFYENILSTWKTESCEHLEGYLLKACDFHIERSRDHNRTELFEFSWGFYRVYPAEILSVLRLREKIGLANPVIEHPLMQLPTAKLFDREIYKDELLEKVKRRAKGELNLTWNI